MDVRMPGMDGLEAVRQIRQGLAGDATIPVIALTGDVMSGEESALLSLGFNAVQPKPVVAVDLLNAVATACA